MIKLTFCRNNAPILILVVFGWGGVRRFIGIWVFDVFFLFLDNNFGLGIFWVLDISFGLGIFCVPVSGFGMGWWTCNG